MSIDIPVIWQVAVSTLIGLVVCLIALFRLWKAYQRLKSDKRGGEVKRGFMTEQWLPLVDPYPWDPNNLRFLGNPIDGIQFEENEIILVEFKSGGSRLSQKQIQIKNLVESGKVSFREVRVNLKDGEFHGMQVL